jgi:hypothetical protein
MPSLVWPSAVAPRQNYRTCDVVRFVLPVMTLLAATRALHRAAGVAAAARPINVSRVRALAVLSIADVDRAIASNKMVAFTKVGRGTACRRMCCARTATVPAQCAACGWHARHSRAAPAALFRSATGWLEQVSSPGDIARPWAAQNRQSHRMQHAGHCECASVRYAWLAYCPPPKRQCPPDSTPVAAAHQHTLVLLPHLQGFR